VRHEEVADHHVEAVIRERERVHVRLAELDVRMQASRELEHLA
jgi:hypothetical protein